MGAALARGCLLVASQQLQDPNFARSVVLVIAHDDEGSFGLVLNRPAERSLGDVLEDVPAKGRAIPLYLGGPVQPEALQFVARASELGRPVLEEVAVGAPLDELLDSQLGPAQVRAYLGYAGWGPAQLESEIAEGSWIIAPARAEHVFDVPSGELWVRVLRELGGRYSWMALGGRDPSAN
ncbi:MAG: YqgE/AlgH family protein [Planctomycetota bacterium]